MLFIKQYWKLILVAVLLLGSNYITKEYVSRGYENTIAEMNVSGLKQTLLLQQQEMSKQKLLIETQEKQNEIDKKRNQQIESDLANANDSVGMLQQRLREMSRNQTSSDSASDIRSAARSATDRLVLSELLGHCAERYKRMALTADRAIKSGLSCQSQYNAIREVINK